MLREGTDNQIQITSKTKSSSKEQLIEEKTYSEMRRRMKNLYSSAQSAFLLDKDRNRGSLLIMSAIQSQSKTIK